MKQEEEYLKAWRENYQKYILDRPIYQTHHIVGYGPFDAKKSTSMSKYPSSMNAPKWHTDYYMTAEDEMGW